MSKQTHTYTVKHGQWEPNIQWHTPSVNFLVVWQMAPAKNHGVLRDQRIFKLCNMNVVETECVMYSHKLAKRHPHCQYSLSLLLSPLPPCGNGDASLQE